MTADHSIDKGKMEQTYNRDAQAFKDNAEQLSTWIYMGGPEIDRFAKGIPNISKAVICDQGSASGRIVKRLVENGAKAENIIGIEISSEQVKIAQGEFPQSRFIVGDLASTKLNPESIDAATQHMVAEHLDNETIALVNANTFEALKPGGKYLVVCTHPSKTGISSKLGDNSGTFITSFPWGGEGPNFHRIKDDLIKTYIDAGFVVDEVKDIKLPPEAKETHPDDYEKYQKYPFVRISITMHKPVV